MDDDSLFLSFFLAFFTLSYNMREYFHPMNKKITPKSTSKISPVTRAVIMTFVLTSGIFFLVWFAWLRDPAPPLLPDRPLVSR
jgi:heme/copper-type cytochrome/quinol oxidase subunit 3